MSQKKLFIASTGKDVGKTTLSLGLIDFFKKQYGSCGFMKPVGQDQLLSEGISLDKDALLIKQYFQLPEKGALSPVSIPQGFTKEFLDGKIPPHLLTQKIKEGFAKLSSYPALILEGTGHLGVGSILNLNNAQVAKLLDCPVLLVTRGGIGSSFDELMLNLSLCEKYQLEVAGVVLNKVIPEKHEVITKYFQKALSNYKIPFLGSMPFDVLLSQATYQDLSQALQVSIECGHDLALKHVEQMTIVASNHQIPEIKPYDLLIVSGTREGLIHAILQHTKSLGIPIGFVITGAQEASSWILGEIEKSSHLVMKCLKSSQEVLLELSSFHSKIQSQDKPKIHEAIRLVQQHLDLEKIHLSLQKSEA